MERNTRRLTNPKRQDGRTLTVQEEQEERERKRLWQSIMDPSNTPNHRQQQPPTYLTISITIMPKRDYEGREKETDIMRQNNQASQWNTHLFLWLFYIAR